MARDKHRARWERRKAKEAAGDIPPMIRCPWCGRQPVGLKRGRLNQHVTPGNLRCVGSGMRPHPDHLKR